MFSVCIASVCLRKPLDYDWLKEVANESVQKHSCKTYESVLRLISSFFCFSLVQPGILAESGRNSIVDKQFLFILLDIIMSSFLD